MHPNENSPKFVLVIVFKNWQVNPKIQMEIQRSKITGSNAEEER